MAMNKTTMGQAMRAAIDAYVAGVPDPKGKNIDRDDTGIF